MSFPFFYQFSYLIPVDFVATWFRAEGCDNSHPLMVDVSRNWPTNFQGKRGNPLMAFIDWKEHDRPDEHNSRHNQPESNNTALVHMSTFVLFLNHFPCTGKQKIVSTFRRFRFVLCR
jgi:hypothetical protein